MTARRWSGIALLVLIALLAVARSSLGTRLDSFTVDEPWHIVAGTSYARGGDFTLNPEHPPLAKLWVGAGMPGDFRVQQRPPLSEKTQEREWVEKTMFFGNDAAAAQQHARRAMWAFHGVLLLALGLLAWRAFGLAWAAGTLAFLAIDPTVGAHLPVVMTDLPLALALMIAALCAGLLASGWRWRWVAGCGLAVGIALGAKHSALAGLAGLGLGLLVVALLGWRGGGAREAGTRLLKLLACGLLAVAVLWAQYGFRFHAAPNGSDAFNRPMPEKIAELRLPHWRGAIAFADEYHLLPRAYLWGLADTVRTGVEGRSIGMHFVWGKVHYGNPPWFSWPAIVLSKLPLALLLLALAAVPLLLRTTLPVAARWSLAAVLAACGFHMAALLGSGGIWGGVRHALPVIAGAAVLAGGALAFAWQRRSRPMLAGVAALYLAAVGMTVREPRLWEYHNELVRGTGNAYRYFGNEGLDLGQRFGEVRAFHDRVIAPSGESLYVNYWMGEQQIRAAHMKFRKPVERLDDTNIDGIYNGWFVYPMSDTLPWPQWDWDPAVVFKDMRMVARFGHVGIWHGTLRRPQTRAGALASRVSDYIYKENGDDWALVATRLEEVVAQMPQKVDAGVELGNAYLRLGRRDEAIAAYRRLLEQDKVPVEPMLAAQLQSHIDLVAAAADPAAIAPMRNPWLE
ncbi:tetratricopeptide repeat protein [Luteimonas sp. 50]|uniref:Tetratricopeptide repeat protein n=1 Tax=Cognatiluteimonas sedimenti TaxID=2927791 RepID=A0ABT0A3S6_9GAMM|nr:tetratricopeptide repeat protein [Lysobacter sedimenti]MCJ0825610.1 tetratricopeptide repeat protein [Lysobacter sedimenti]